MGWGGGWGEREEGRRAVQGSAGEGQNRDIPGNISVSESNASPCGWMETSGRPCQGWPSSQPVKVSMELPGDLFQQVSLFVIQTQLIARLTPFLTGHEYCLCSNPLFSLCLLLRINFLELN